MDDLPTGTQLPLRTYCEEKKHPSNGGIPYLHDFQEQVLRWRLQCRRGPTPADLFKVHMINTAKGRAKSKSFHGSGGGKTNKKKKETMTTTTTTKSFRRSFHNGGGGGNDSKAPHPCAG